MDFNYEQQVIIDGINFDLILKDIQGIDPYIWEQQLLRLCEEDIQSVLMDDQEQPTMNKSESVDFCDAIDIFNVCTRDDVCSPTSSNTSLSSLDDDTILLTRGDILDQAIEQELGSLWNDSPDEPVLAHTITNVHNIGTQNKCVPTIPFEAPYGSRQQEPYMEMIAKAIMTSAAQRLLLSHIYAYIQHTYPDFTSSKGAWKNSVRHNLSVNECFVKDGRAPNGRGFYWKIHVACLSNFRRGNFIRRDALSEVYKHQRQNAYFMSTSQVHGLQQDYDLIKHQKQFSRGPLHNNLTHNIQLKDQQKIHMLSQYQPMSQCQYTTEISESGLPDAGSGTISDVHMRGLPQYQPISAVNKCHTQVLQPIQNDTISCQQTNQYITDHSNENIQYFDW